MPVSLEPLSLQRRHRRNQFNKTAGGIRMKRSKILIITLFIVAAATRFADVFRPINQASWRECDLGAVSRNFAREGMNPFYPRIDWRGDGPGYAEMELPLFPFLTSIAYTLFGIHDQFGRVLAFLFSLAALFFFFRLARQYLSFFAAVIAFAFFAFNPLIIDQSTALQPEGLMLFAYIASVYFFTRWLKNDDTKYFCAAIGSTALTLLAKAPAAHIGLFFGILLIEKYGWKAIKETKVWIFGIYSILPSTLWYLHAKNLWLTYGNSLGVSNEYHWIGLDFFTDTSFLTGILRSELMYVWVVFGIIVGAFAIWKGYRERTAQHSLLWLASIFALYILAARTTSEEWANYYHVFSIPPVALIFGFSIEKLKDHALTFADNFSSRTPAANLGRIAVFLFVVAAVFASFLLEAKQVRASFLGKRVADESHLCADKIRPELKADGLIVVSGGHCVDNKGYALAYNASFMFYWLERKGWNICVEDQSIDKLNGFAVKGAKYFVAQKSILNQRPDFENDLRQVYSVIAECNEFLIFDLTWRR